MAQAPTSEQLLVNGVSLSIRKQGTGPPLLYLHDELTSAWHSFLDALAAKFTVYAPDLPGFGESQRPGWIENMDDVAFFLADVVDAVRGDTPLAVVGAGLGGWLAIETGLRNASSIGKLVLISSPGIEIKGDPPFDYFFLTPPERVALFFNDPSAAPEVDEDHMIRNEQMTARLVWQPRYVSPKLQVRAHRLTAPTLVVWGSNDRFLSIAHGERLVEALPDARLLVVPGTGHFPALENPSELSPAVIEFLS